MLIDSKGNPVLAANPNESMQELATRHAEAIAKDLIDSGIPMHFFLAVYPPQASEDSIITFRTITPRAFLPRMLKFLWEMAKREKRNQETHGRATPLKRVQ
jgi:hypothetical protein